MNKVLIIGGICLLAFAVTGNAASGAENDKTAGSTGVPVLIAPGDLLSITVYDNPDMAQEVRVEAGGEVNLNLIGPVKLAGMTAQQAGEWIAGEYGKRKYLIKPQVTVLVKEYSTQGVSVTGEVTRPGVYPVLSTRGVLDVISLAGGLTSLADTRVTIKHRSGSEETVTVRLKADEPGAAITENAMVYPGDLVFVPRAGVVYVLGDVGRPGGILMQDNGKISLLQALAQAGGANFTAAMNSASLLRKKGTGYATTKVRLGDLVRGRQNDMELASNDILFVPSSRLKHLAEQTNSVVSSAVGASVYHVIP